MLIIIGIIKHHKFQLPLERLNHEPLARPVTWPTEIRLYVVVSWMSDLCLEKLYFYVKRSLCCFFSLIPQTFLSKFSLPYYNRCHEKLSNNRFTSTNQKLEYTVRSVSKSWACVQANADFASLNRWGGLEMGNLHSRWFLRYNCRASI